MIRYFFAYRYGVAVGITTTLSLLAVQHYKTWFSLFIFALIWSGIAGGFMYYLQRKIGKHREYISLLISTALSFAGLTSLIEDPSLRLFLNILAGVAVFFVFASASRDAYEKRSGAKQWRRVNMMLWAFSLYGFQTTLFALSLFFPSFPAFLFASIAGAVAAFVSFNLWRLYITHEHKRELMSWSGLIAILTIQFYMVSVYALPFGYLAMGLLFSWFWYLVQLLIRFHLSPKGIIWAKQKIFLTSNIILYMLFLFEVVRWI